MRCRPIPAELGGATAIERHDGSAKRERLRDGEARFIVKRRMQEHPSRSDLAQELLTPHAAFEAHAVGHTQSLG
jgi:hypothetical protein